MDKTIMTVVAWILTIWAIALILGSIYYHVKTNRKCK